MSNKRDAYTLVRDLYDKGHGKRMTIRRMIDVLGVEEVDAEILFRECLENFSSPLPSSDCKNCKYDALPHEGGHCYMFAESPGPFCAQFDRKK